VNVRVQSLITQVHPLVGSGTEHLVSAETHSEPSGQVHAHWQVLALNCIFGPVQLGVKPGPGPTPGVHE
jgi:hypothetical protein